MLAILLVVAVVFRFMEVPGINELIFDFNVVGWMQKRSSARA